MDDLSDFSPETKEVPVLLLIFLPLSIIMLFVSLLFFSFYTTIFLALIHWLENLTLEDIPLIQDMIDHGIRLHGYKIIVSPATALASEGVATQAAPIGDVSALGSSIRNH